MVLFLIYFYLIYLFFGWGVDFSFVNVGNCQLKPLLLPFLPLSLWLSHYSANDCYSDVALSNFHDRGCGSRNPPLASLTRLSLLPISKLIINIYDVIWIMWIGMTQYHFEKWRVEIGGRWGMGSSRGERIFHNWNVSQGSCFETLEVQRYNEMRWVLTTLCAPRKKKNKNLRCDLYHSVLSLWQGYFDTSHIYSN